MEFEVMFKDLTMAEVKINTKECYFDQKSYTVYDSPVEVKRYSNKPKVAQPFISDSVSLHKVYEFLESRCFPRDRIDCKTILASMGLDSYDVEKIVRITHGAMLQDFTWIRFKNETLKWSDVDVRKKLRNTDGVVYQ